MLTSEFKTHALREVKLDHFLLIARQLLIFKLGQGSCAMSDVSLSAGEQWILVLSPSKPTQIFSRFARALYLAVYHCNTTFTTRLKKSFCLLQFRIEGRKRELVKVVKEILEISKGGKVQRANMPISFPCCKSQRCSNKEESKILCTTIMQVLS